MPATARFPALPYLFACLLGLFAIGGLWYGLGQPVVLPDAATPTHKLQCASYTPFDKDQSPFDQPFALRPERMDALLLLHPIHKVLGREPADRGDYFLEPGGHLRHRGIAMLTPFAFASVSVCDARLFEDSPNGAFSLLELWHRAEAAKRRAEERLARPTGDMDFERARIAMLRAIARLNVSRQVRSRG